MNQFPQIDPRIVEEQINYERQLQRRRQTWEATRKFEAAVFWLVIFPLCIFGALLVIPS